MNRHGYIEALSKLYRLRDEGKDVDAEIARLEKLVIELTDEKINGEREDRDSDDE